MLALSWCRIVEHGASLAPRTIRGREMCLTVLRAVSFIGGSTISKGGKCHGCRFQRLVQARCWGCISPCARSPEI